MTGNSHSCQECGADIETEDATCPKCGYEQIRKTTGSAAIKKGQELYRGHRESRSAPIDDGMLRRRPHSGSGSIKEAVRQGGRSGNVQVCMKCRHVQNKIRDNCESCGSALKK